MNEENRLQKLKLNEASKLAQETTDVNVIIELSKHSNPLVRKRSLIQMCPCRVKEDIEKFWIRVFEMKNDEDALVRAQVLHTLCDGSPKHMEQKVYEALDQFNRDSDTEIRRKAHKVLSNYNKTGKWNIL
jgi:hypothetical protein